MKRVKCILIAAVIALSVALMAALISCDKDRLKLDIDIDFDTAFDTYDRAEGLSAYDVFTEAYGNYVKDENYSFLEYFDFSAKAIGAEVATQQRKIVKKVENGKIYENRVVVGTGQGAEHKASKFYYDGERAYVIDIDDKSIVPNKGSGDEIFAVTDYGNYAPFAGSKAELEGKLKEYREKICYYDFTKREYLSAQHDDNVYVKDDLYYMNISFDSSKEAMNSFNSDSRDAFISSLGIKDKDRDSLKLLEDSVYKIVAAKIDGTYKFVGMRLIETYEGKVGVTAKAQNVDTFIFDYSSEACKINADDLAGL